MATGYKTNIGVISMGPSPGVGKILAYNTILDGSRALPYEMDRGMSNLSLTEYTEKAIELLSQYKNSMTARDFDKTAAMRLALSLSRC